MNTYTFANVGNRMGRQIVLELENGFFAIRSIRREYRPVGSGNVTASGHPKVINIGEQYGVIELHKNGVYHSTLYS